MEEPIIIDMRVIEEHRKAAARRERKQKWQQFKQQVGNYCQQNWPKLLAAATPVAIGAGRAIVKGHERRAKVRNELRTKDLRVYDTSLGHYWELRRKLTNREWVVVETRRARGERLATILSEMNVLK